MSLLMDALRRAEEAKRQAGAAVQSPTAKTPAELSLDPIEAPAPPGRSLPPLSSALAAAEGDLAFAEDSPRDRRQAPRVEPTLAAQAASADQAARAAAKNVFAVKQAARSPAWLWIALGTAAVVAIGIGGYFWWQLQGVSTSSLVRPPGMTPPLAAAPPLAPAAPTAQPAAPQLPADTPASAAPAGTLAAAPAAVPPAAGPVQAERMSPAAPGDVPSSRPERTARAASSSAGQPAGVFRTSRGRPGPDQTLNEAYQAWLAGRFDDARRAYEQVLRGDPRNVDALLGLAAIESRNGRNERAHELYLRALEADPSDATAQAALINLRGASDSGQSESRLKTLLAGQPDSPALHFALGNLYARQGRWSEAQQAYFQAYALEPDNADYLFNVAVSLDHLRQGKLAAQYYRMALAAAETRPGAFDAAAAGKRLLELQY
ncbi:tetratricopeptide repeat protein [Accumulibacter sp.]|uniref:tetratricopeptide repeat protein n=1 Tax=Accumulibacter sp. TaxID=2053492 RepID=UPI0025D12576|nr:tetratricopeptide repeat protein [Accumulibacter sp.]MCM8594715.1 tetratricopeptide repeat protein [Accumulibacter sp.]MCM8625869.1 tetratricopeptide repeat protein [Accumulibacter sp.]MDS4048861.1 tetratricopeptide repeat protein [Accumulibacter sp.]